MQDIKVPTMLTIAECAKETGLSYNCLRNLCIDNKIVFIRSGAKKAKYLINFEKLLDYLNGKDTIE